MRRRTFDLLVPLAYGLAVIIAAVFRNEAVLGGIALLGAVGVGAYFHAIRSYLKACSASQDPVARSGLKSRRCSLIDHGHAAHQTARDRPVPRGRVPLSPPDRARRSARKLRGVTAAG